MIMSTQERPGPLQTEARGRRRHSSDISGIPVSPSGGHLAEMYVVPVQVTLV